MDVRAAQAPLRATYQEQPEAAALTLVATASSEDGNPASCSIDIGRAIYEAQAHSGVGGPGTAACSGDLLLGALAACAQITCQMAAAASAIPLRSVRVTVEGDLDLRGTLGMSRHAPVGFTSIRTRFAIDAPEASERQLRSLERATEQFCVVLQTLLHAPIVETTWSSR